VDRGSTIEEHDTPGGN
jgi:hypothetical protein